VVPETKFVRPKGLEAKRRTALSVVPETKFVRPKGLETKRRTALSVVPETKFVRPKGLEAKRRTALSVVPETKFVRPKGLEPLSVVPETTILSIELRAQTGCKYRGCRLRFANLHSKFLANAHKKTNRPIKN
jgi:hypothetical protein